MPARGVSVLVVGDDDAHMGRRARMMSIRLGDRVTLVTSSAASIAEPREHDHDP